MSHGTPAAASRTPTPEWMPENIKEFWRAGRGATSESEIDEDEWGRETEEEDLEAEETSDDEEFPWLKHLNAVAKDPNGQEVGRCHAMLIERDRIRSTFWNQMEGGSQATSDLGFALFDRWGCLQPHFYEHPVKKGTGAWGRELDDGPFLLIERLSVAKESRRQGYGKKLVADLWEQALKAAPGCAFAVVWPTYLNDYTLEHENPTPEQIDNVYSELSRISEDFWRSIGFRRIGSSVWFGLATEPTHKARVLSATEDYRRPFDLRRDPFQASQTWPYDQAIFKADDDTTLSLLKARLDVTPVSDPLWLSVDRHGNTILHLVSLARKALTLTWLLQHPFANTLLSMRNLEGNTALEDLQSVLENGRREKHFSTVEIVKSDEFDGFAPIEVKCLSLLSGIVNPSSDQILRLQYGCTCGLCLAGFISPRLSQALKCQADLARDTLNDHLIDTSGSEWVRYWDINLMHTAPEVRVRFYTTKAFRKAFVTTFGYVAKCLRRRVVPKRSHLQHLAEGEKESQVGEFLHCGGTVASAVLACFDRVLDEDVYLGDGEHQEGFEEEIKSLPTCRNDREFAFACRQYCLLEGLPANAARHVTRRMQGAYLQ